MIDNRTHRGAHTPCVNQSDFWIASTPRSGNHSRILQIFWLVIWSPHAKYVDFFGSFSGLTQAQWAKVLLWKRHSSVKFTEKKIEKKVQVVVAWDCY